MKRLLLILLVAAPATAADLSTFEKVLVPVLNSHVISGANGSAFDTPLLIWSDVPFLFYPASENGQPAVSSFGQHPGEPWGTFPSNDYGVYFEPGVSAGRVLFFERSVSDRVGLGYTIRSRRPDGSFEEIEAPVVRERNFLRGRSTLVGIVFTPLLGPPGYQAPAPLVGDAQRNALRIYDVDNTSKLHVTATFHVIPGSFPAEPFAIEVGAELRDGGDPSYPYYGQASITSRYVCGWPTLFTPCIETKWAITIEPTDPTIRYWAFVSETNNTTNDVTLRTPQ